MRNFLPTLFAALALAGCRTGAPTSAASHPPPAPYTRVANSDSNTVSLQIALRKFVPARKNGPAVWLAGTMHVGEPQYYHALQNFLDAQTVVLYEGINTETHSRHVPHSSAAQKHSPPPPDSAVEPETNSTDSGFSMQSAMADSLGLVFQLNAIDYDRTNFLNSDLSVLQIQRLMTGVSNGVPAAPGQGASNPSFDALLQIMDGSSFLGSLFKVGLQFIGSNPKLQGVAKLTLIEAVGRLKGDLSDMRDVPPDWKQLLKVLIAARNQNVLADLKTEFKLVPRDGSIAIFYGTGHMDDLQQRLEHELHYRAAGDQWLTAFSVDLRKSGISPGEAQITRNLIKWQIDQMQ